MASKLSPQELLSVSNKMFYIGFALLPLVWLTHILFIYPELTKCPQEQIQSPQPETSPHQPTIEQQNENMMEIVGPKLKRNLRNSAIGLAVYTTAFAAWLAVFITQRDQWQELGDQLCIEVPRG